MLRTTPVVNSIVMTPNGKGTVVDSNVLTGILQVHLDSSAPDAAPQSFKVAQVKLPKGGRISLDRKELEELKDLEKD